MCFLELHRQFDTLVLPATKGLFSSIREALSTWSLPEQPEFKVPDVNWMRQVSLEIHLQPTQRIFLEGDYSAQYDIDFATNRVVDLYDCCFHQHVLTGQQNSNDWTIKSVKQV